MIAEILNHGQENAITGRELATITNMKLREVTQQIERERRQGEFICASSSNDNPGYYIGTAEETAAYCERIKHRAIEMFITRQAIVKALRELEQGTEGE